MEDNKELEGEFYTLTDEDGHEIQFEVIGSAVLNDKTYYAMVPTEDQPEDDEVCEYVILRADQDENGEDILVTVDDDEEFEGVADYFDDMLSDEADYDINPAEEQSGKK